MTRRSPNLIDKSGLTKEEFDAQRKARRLRVAPVRARIKRIDDLLHERDSDEAHRWRDPDAEYDAMRDEAL